MTAMKIGIAYPTNEVVADPDALRRFCPAVEQLGFAHLMAYDHVVKCLHEDRDPPLNGPYTEKDAFHDPLVLFAFAAALTTTLEFVSGVMVLPQRQTALVAQQAADIDLLSRERLRLGVGIGWNYVEYEALGQEFKSRAKRIEEQVDLLRQLWTAPIVDFRGRFDRINRAGMNPRPRRAVPLWLGGHSEPAYARGARIGDGFVFAAPGEGAVEALARVRHHLQELNRPEAEFGKELLAIFAADKQAAADHLRRWRDAGGTHATIHTMGKGLGGDVDAHVAFADEVKRMVEAG